MLGSPALYRSTHPPPGRRGWNGASALARALRAGLVLLLMTGALPAGAAIVWSDLGATLVHETGAGSDILRGALKRDDSSTDTLYFKFHVDPLSDAGTEEYFAAFQLYEGDNERLGVGNSLKAWAYSAFNTAETGASNKVFGDMDLRSVQPESSGTGTFLPFEFPRRGVGRTIVFKVQYLPGQDDRVTVWLNPDLAPGATEEHQPDGLITKFAANASFNEIRLRHGGGGGGWTFSDMAIATSFSDFVSAGAGEPGGAGAPRGDLPLTFQTWQREQGLPQNSVRALAQTRDGYLWVGSDDGLARFDGVRFVSFGMRDGLPGGPVGELFEDSRGILWIGTVAGGLTRYQDGHFVTLTLQDGLPADSIDALAEDNQGQLWIGTEAGLAIWDHGRLGTPAAAAQFNGKAITCLFKDARGTLWLGARGAGVFQYTQGKFKPLTDGSVETLLQDPHCVLADRAGRVWVGAGDDFVLCLDGDQWRRYRIPRHVARPYVSALAEEPDGTIWAGSVSEGLYQFKAGKVLAVNASSGLLDNFVESLLVDHDGNLWVGTIAGLNRLRRSNLTVLRQGEGLGYGAVQGLAEIAPNRIWAGKPGDGVYVWEGYNFSHLVAADLSRRYPEVNALLKSRDGSCWVGGAFGLLHFKNPKTAPGEPESPVLAGSNVIALAQDREGRIWAGTREGALWRLRDGTWEKPAGYSRPHAVTALLPDTNGAIWIGTQGSGLDLFKEGDGVRAHFDRRNGLLSDLVRALYLDAQGTLWIGTAGGGLSRWHQGHMATFTQHEGLPDDTISQILEDDSGRLWLGGNRGVACVAKTDLDALAAGKVLAVYPRVYGRAEGMPSEECTGGFCPAGLKTKSGLLWFATLKGIVVVDPRPQTTIARPPTVVLEEVVVDGIVDRRRPIVSLPASPGEAKSGAVEPAPDVLRIPPGKHRIEFRFTGLSFDAPARVRFRYRLEGLEAGWVEAGTQRTAPYGYVPPGNYRFHVIACNSDGVWNETGAELALNVRPYFWQSWWFLGLAALGLLASLGGLIRFIEQRKIKRRLLRLEQERALERERGRIAQDLHDDLGSSLARISLLSGLIQADKDNPGQVETHAAKISQSANQTVRALEEIVWAVRPGSDSLQSLVEYIAHFANELFEGNNTRCRLDLPHDLPALPLPPDVRHNIFLIVKEALTNALKHAAAKEVRVRAIAPSPGSVEIVIQDDGKGFDAAAAPATGKRHGLGNMRRRAEAIGAQLHLETTPGQGTTVRLTVNLPDGETA